MAQEHIMSDAMEGTFVDTSDDYTAHHSGKTTLGSFEFMSAQDSSFSKTTEDPIVCGSSSHLASSSSEYFSARIHELSQRRIEAGTDVEALAEAEIEASKVHWTELKSGDDEDDAVETNVEEVFQSLQEKYGFFTFFRSWTIEEWVMGPKVAEGGQAEIYDAEFVWDDGTKSHYKGVLKVMKEGSALRDLQRQWPQEMINIIRGGTYYWTTNCCAIWGGRLLQNGRFAFLMPKYWGDLRKLIDLKMHNNHNCGSPFTDNVVKAIMYEIASGMFALSEDKIIHGDLKASNVLIGEYKESTPLNPTFDPIQAHKFHCHVADFECSVGVVGTGFWRAPEILQALTNGQVAESNGNSDVYSYAMTCYEILTGHIPFEGKKFRPSYNSVVLRGERPELPRRTKPWIRTLLNRCWHQDPSKRPTFQDIIAIIDAQIG